MARKLAKPTNEPDILTDDDGAINSNINGDGLDDIIVGAPRANPGGKSYVIFGSANPAGPVDLATLGQNGGTPGFVINGAAAFDQFGYSVSSAGDINGDGFDDLIVGARYADKTVGIDSFEGKSYVIFGSANPAGEVNVASLTDKQGFVINGAAAKNQTGYSVSAAGDIDGDGFDDLIVSAPRADRPGQAATDNAGASYVIYGQAFGKASTAFNLTATAGADKLIGGWGNDVITGINSGDSARGGAGDDVLELTGTDFIDIDGGNGFDALKITGAGDVFDFTAGPVNGKILGSRIDSIEAFDLSASGAQSLKLDRLDVFHLSENTEQVTIAGVTKSFTTLIVLGANATDDKLTLARFDADATNDATDTWVKSAGTVTDSHFAGLSFEEYLNGNARVLVEVNDVGVTLNV